MRWLGARGLRPLVFTFLEDGLGAAGRGDRPQECRRGGRGRRLGFPAKDQEDKWRARVFLPVQPTRGSDQSAIHQGPIQEVHWRSSRGKSVCLGDDLADDQRVLAKVPATVFHWRRFGRPPDADSPRSPALAAGGGGRGEGAGGDTS